MTKQDTTKQSKVRTLRGSQSYVEADEGNKCTSRVPQPRSLGCLQGRSVGLEGSCHLCDFNRRAHAHTQEHQHQTITLQTFFGRKKEVLFCCLLCDFKRRAYTHTQEHQHRTITLQTFFGRKKGLCPYVYCHLCDFNRRANTHTQEHQQRTLTLQTFFGEKALLCVFVCLSLQATSFNTSYCRMLYYVPYDVDLGCWEVFVGVSKIREVSGQDVG
jgi:uncharacterized protein Veg